jgi:hypothetical protein
MAEEDHSQTQPAARPRGIDWAILASIFAALIAFLGNLVVSNMQASNQLAVEKLKNDEQLQLEQKKHQSSLVEKAITSDLESTKKLFKFYLDTGLLSDPNGRIATFLTKNEDVPTLPSKGAIACYSHSEAGSSYPVAGDIYVMGIIDGLNGRYNGRIFQPEGHESEDISALQDFKNLCNSRFPSCKNGCWAGGDTGGFYGYK